VCSSDLRKTGQDPVPLCHMGGRVINLDDPEFQKLLAPFKEGTKEKPHKSISLTDNEAASEGWRGFKAADAAADLLPSITDKRANEDNP